MTPDQFEVADVSDGRQQTSLRSRSNDPPTAVTRSRDHGRDRARLPVIPAGVELMALPRSAKVPQPASRN